MYSSIVPPVFLEADDARDEGLEPPMAGMALEAARAISLPPPPVRAGPYELLSLLLLLLRSSVAESCCEGVVGGEKPYPAIVATGGHQDTQACPGDCRVKSCCEGCGCGQVASGTLQWTPRLRNLFI